MDHYSRGNLTFDVREGGPADGTPVVLLHGFPQDGSCWDAVSPELHAAGLRTLAPDQRGYSPGARPAGRGAYRLGECALDVVALLDAAGLESAHVVGHDWGGAVAWHLGGRHADRVRSLTVLSTPHPVAMKRAFTRSSQGLRSWYMLAFQLPVLPELLLGRVGERALQRSGLPPERARYYAERLAAPGAMSAALNWYRAMPAGFRESVGRCRVPTTYVWGRKDTALGRAAAEETGDFVSADYRFVEVDGGHWLPEKRAAEMAGHVVERVTGAA